VGDVGRELAVERVTFRGLALEVVLKQPQERLAVLVADPDHRPLGPVLGGWGHRQQLPLRPFGLGGVTGEPLERFDLQRVGGFGAFEDDHDAERPKLLHGRCGPGALAVKLIEGSIELALDRLAVRAILDVSDLLVATPATGEGPVLGAAADPVVGERPALGLSQRSRPVAR
jgi:hypothetical protein